LKHQGEQSKEKSLCVQKLFKLLMSPKVRSCRYCPLFFNEQCNFNTCCLSEAITFHSEAKWP
jgi:hypothetical protein